jgi:DNA modification methylase
MLQPSPSLADWLKSRGVPHVSPQPGIDLFHGDSKQLLHDLTLDPANPPPCVDMVLMDPPYGIKYVGMGHHRALANDEAPPVWCIEPSATLLKDDGAMLVCTRYDVYRWWEDAMEHEKLNIKTPIIWDKQQWTMGDSASDLRRQNETIMVAHKGRALLRPWTDERFTADRAKMWSEMSADSLNEIIRLAKDFTADGGTDKSYLKLREAIEDERTSMDKVVKRDTCLWSIRVPRDKQSQRHPTPKPPELMERALLNYTDRGQLVLDPFMGGGPVGVAAVRQGRHYLGIELDAEYFGYAVENITRAVEDQWQ